MRTYHIGLDFGTYQSKACIFDLQNETHEFFSFKTNNKFFQPSRVGKKSDGTLEYGSTISGLSIEDYYYFKIAAAEDEEFLAETFDQQRTANSKLYAYEEFKTFSPEFLSLVYLTYILFTIKEDFQKRKGKPATRGVLLRRLLTTKLDKKEDLKFTIQIGIPTEWSQLKNLKRKRKFENILMGAELLQQKYQTLDAFLKASAINLIENVRIIQSNLFENIEQFNIKLNELGISVYPETAAGLAFITKTKQLTPGYYTIMDIGGGSTDISFFFLDAKSKMHYLASESYLMAANNVYALVAKSNSVLDIHKTQEEVFTLIKNDSWEQNAAVFSAMRQVRKDLDKNCAKLFNKRVYWYHKGQMLEKFKNQPIILYGGGARLPLINKGSILIHDNGSLSLTAPCTYIQKQNIDSYTTLINILPNDNSWKTDFALLVVALGLSYIKTDSSAVWFDDRDYNSSDGDLVNSVSQSSSEDCYLYDILDSKWSVTNQIESKPGTHEVRQRCRCDGSNEDCNWCGGSGFIDKRKVYDNSVGPANKNKQLISGEKEKTDSKQIELIEKINKEGTNFKASYKQIKQQMQETPATLYYIKEIRKIAFDLKKLERSFKESFVFLNFFNSQSADFRNFIQKFIELRSIYINKFQKLCHCSDDTKEL